LARDKSLPKYIKDIYLQHKKTRTRPDLEELLRGLSEVIEPHSRDFIFIDALDECDDRERRILVSKIFTIPTTKSVNITFTSRSVPDIQKLKEMEYAQHLEIQATIDDIGIYVDSNMYQLPAAVQSDMQLQNDIRTQIRETNKQRYAISVCSFTYLYRFPG
jgi:hypothetical protein